MTDQDKKRLEETAEDIKKYKDGIVAGALFDLTNGAQIKLISQCDFLLRLLDEERERVSGTLKSAIKTMLDETSRTRVRKLLVSDVKRKLEIILEELQ